MLSGPPLRLLCQVWERPCGGCLSSLLPGHFLAFGIAKYCRKYDAGHACYQVTFLSSDMPSTAESTMLVMLATRSLSCLQACPALQKVRCWSCLLPGHFLAFRHAQHCRKYDAGHACYQVTVLPPELPSTAESII